MKADARGNRYLVKAQQRGRIDGLVVLAMLAGAAEARGMTDEVSFWEAA